jgi:hypothetical protein
MVRDTEVAVTMTLETAKRVKEKLDEVLKNVEAASSQVDESRK